MKSGRLNSSSSKPRLLVVGSLPPPYSGYETATQVLMESGIRNHFRIRLLNTRTTRNPSARGRLSLANVLSTFQVLLKLIFELIRFRPHIANIPLAQNRTGFLKWLSLTFCCKVAQCKIVSRLGGASFNKFYEASTPLMQSTIRFGLCLVDTLIVRGPSLKQQFNGLVRGEQIQVVPNGFDIQGWKSGLPLKQRKTSKCLHVLYLGQVSKAKGVLDLLEAVAILEQQDRVHEYEFVVAGPIIERELNIRHIDNPENTSKAIREITDRLNLEEGLVRFVGEVSWEEKRKLYVWADVVVLPSYSEGFPYTVLEAFASECAVICTPVGALPDHLRDGEQVLFVPVNSPPSIANALIRLKDYRLRLSLTRKASQYLLENHSLNIFSIKMTEIFHQVLDPKA